MVWAVVVSGSGASLELSAGAAAQIDRLDCAAYQQNATALNVLGEGVRRCPAQVPRRHPDPAPKPPQERRLVGYSTMLSQPSPCRMNRAQ